MTQRHVGAKVSAVLIALAAMITFQIAYRSGERAVHTVRSPIIPPSFTDPPAYDTGIIDDSSGPFSAQEFEVTNRWSGPGGSEGWLSVYAGGLRTDPGTSKATVAAIRVFTLSANPAAATHLTEVGTFTAPGQAATLTITEATGSVLHVTTDSGVTLSFDTVTDQFQ